MGRTKGTFGSSSPRGNSFGKGGKLSTKVKASSKNKPTKRTKCK